MPDPAEIDDRIDRASARPFGRRFHLRGRERATAELRGPQTMRAHAAEIIAERLAPAEPRHDGVAQLWFDSPAALAAAFDSPAGKELQADGPKMIDMRLLRFFLADETVVIASR